MNFLSVFSHKLGAFVVADSKPFSAYTGYPRFNVNTKIDSHWHVSRSCLNDDNKPNVYCCTVFFDPSQRHLVFLFTFNDCTFFTAEY